MKNYIMPLIIALLIIIVIPAILGYKDAKYEATVAAYEQDARAQHELWKACDVTRQYYEVLLDKYDIENILK